MEARLISERNYWKNKFEKLEESNLQSLKDAQELTEFYRKQHDKMLLSWVKLINKSLEKQRMQYKTDFFY